MGLDSVELVLRLEETFGVTLSDAEAQQVVTVGDAFATLAHKTSSERRDTCLSALAFYRVRRTLCELLPVKRRDIRPSTPLETLIPRARRQAVWRTLQDRAGLSLPGLSRPKWLGTVLLFAATTAFSSWTLVNRLPLGQFGLVVQVLCVLFLVALGVLFVATLPFATRLPNQRSTVGEAAQLLAVNNQSVLMHQARGWTRGELWETLQSLIVEQLGVERSKVLPDVRLVDLGLS